MMFHKLLPRAWLLAFPLPRQTPAAIAAAEAADDFRKILKGKSARANRFFSKQTTPMACAVESIVTEPVEHLLRVVQELDSAGGVLRVLASDSNPFTLCVRDLSRLLGRVESDDRLKGLFHQYGCTIEDCFFSGRWLVCLYRFSNRFEFCRSARVAVLRNPLQSSRGKRPMLADHSHGASSAQSWRKLQSKGFRYALSCEKDILLSGSASYGQSQLASKNLRGKERSALVRCIRELVVQLVGEIWLLQQRYKQYPYALIKTCLPVPQPEHLGSATAFFQTSECCLDRGFSLKAAREADVRPCGSVVV